MTEFDAADEAPAISEVRELMEQGHGTIVVKNPGPSTAWRGILSAAAHFEGSGYFKIG